MKYSVGDLANLMDITPGALHFYEKKNIINPRRTAGGHRSYDIEDVVRLLSYKKYNAMGLSIKSIIQQFDENKDTWDIVANRLLQQAASVMEKARYYEHLSHTIQELAENILLLEQGLRTYSFFLRPACYILFDPKNYLLSHKPEVQAVIRQWVKRIPDTKITFILPEQTEKEALLGYMVTEETARFLKMPVDCPSVRYLPATVCLRTMDCITNAYKNPPKVFRQPLGYIKDKSLETAGYSLATTLMVEGISPEEYRAYLDYTLPLGIK